MSRPVVKWAMSCAVEGPPQLVALRMDGEKWVCSVPVILDGIEAGKWPPEECTGLLRTRMRVASETARGLDIANRSSAVAETHFVIIGDAS